MLSLKHDSYYSQLITGEGAIAFENRIGLRDGANQKYWVSVMQPKIILDFRAQNQKDVLTRYIDRLAGCDPSGVDQNLESKMRYSDDEIGAVSIEIQTRIWQVRDDAKEEWRAR